MYIEREIYSKISQFLPRREIIAIVGPRQAGKTTLLGHLRDDLEAQGKKVAFLTFERPSDLALFTKDIEIFAQVYAGFDVIIIDEFHNAKEGGKALKFLYDTTPIKFIISGSSSLDLAFATKRYLVGRMITFSLFPFSFREFLTIADANLARVLKERIDDAGDIFSSRFKPFGNELTERYANYFNQYLVWGGYPAVTLAPLELRQAMLKELFDTYLVKDIQTLLKLSTESELVTLFKLLAAQIGNLVSYHELSGGAGLVFPALKKHLKILEETFIVNFTTPFFKNKRSEITKAPKVYFYDLGLRNAAVENFSDVSFREDAGHMAENFVRNGLRLRGQGRIYFWRSQSGAEVDFVIEGNGEIVPIEVKYSVHPTVGKSMYSFIKKYRPKSAFILTKQTTHAEIIDGCQVYMRPMFYL